MIFPGSQASQKDHTSMRLLSLHCAADRRPRASRVTSNRIMHRASSVSSCSSASRWVTQRTCGPPRTRHRGRSTCLQRPGGSSHDPHGRHRYRCPAGGNRQSPIRSAGLGSGPLRDLRFCQECSGVFRRRSGPSAACRGSNSTSRRGAWMPARPGEPSTSIIGFLPMISPARSRRLTANTPT